MADAPCAICDSTNETLRLCDRCRQDPANADWSEGDELPENRRVSAERVDVSNLPPSSAFDFMGRKARTVTVARQKALTLLYHFTIRVPYRNRTRGRTLGVEWRWVSRPLNLSEVAWLVGITPQAVVQGIRFEMEMKHAQRRVRENESTDSCALITTSNCANRYGAHGERAKLE